MIDFKREEADFKNILTHFTEELKQVRTGRAGASLVENILVESYGSQMPLKYFPGFSRVSESFPNFAIWVAKRAMKQRKQSFLHRGRPAYVVQTSKMGSNIIFSDEKGFLCAGKIFISDTIKGANEKETQIFREIVAEHEIAHFFTFWEDTHPFPILMELRYAVEKGKLKDWLKFVNKNLNKPAHSERVIILKRYYPKIARKIGLFR